MVYCGQKEDRCRRGVKEKKNERVNKDQIMEFKNVLPRTSYFILRAMRNLGKFKGRLYFYRMAF